MALYTVQRCFLKSLILILGLMVNLISHASGGYDEDRGLYGQHSPDFPLNEFVNGRIGVITPHYRLSYLIIAYRYLSNHPLSKKEQRQVLDTFAIYFTDVSFSENDFRVDVHRSNRQIARQSYKRDIYNVEQAMYPWWEDSKKLPLAKRVETLIKGYPKGIKPFTKFKLASRRLGLVFNELHAAKRPEEQINAFLQAWLNAQDELFSPNYDGDKIRAAIRKIPAATLPALTLDTDYMNAVSYFNSENETELLRSFELFTELAQNKQYPWHEWADYLSNRALTRAACQDFTSAKPDARQIQLLSTARAGMARLAMDAADPSVKKAASRYKNIINGRVDPKGTIVELAKGMNQTITGNHFSDLIFYNELAGWNFIQAGSPHALNWDKITPDSEILFWVTQYLSQDEHKSFTTAYEQWSKSPGNSAWLLIALNHIKQANPSQQQALLTAAEQVTPSQPGFFSVRSSLIKALFLLQGNTRSSILKRHALIDHTLAQLTPGQDFSTRMHFVKMAIPLADSIDNLLSYGFFIPSATLLAIYPPQTPISHPYFSPLELSQALNYLPLSVLSQVIQSNQLPRVVQPALYASVWARAMLLRQYQIADQIAQKTGELNPAMKATLFSSLNAKNSDQRFKVLVKALLYFPELSPIINLQNTWTPEFDYTKVYYGIKRRKITHGNSHTYWCNHGEINRLIYDYRPSSQFFPSPWLNLLTPEQQKELDAEQAQLQRLPDGATWLANKATELAIKYPKDKENAELLALAIHVTHVLACYQPDSFASRRSYLTLKRLYPASDAAKRTPYYY